MLHKIAADCGSAYQCAFLQLFLDQHFGALGQVNSKAQQQDDNKISLDLYTIFEKLVTRKRYWLILLPSNMGWQLHVIVRTLPCPMLAQSHFSIACHYRNWQNLIYSDSEYTFTLDSLYRGGYCFEQNALMAAVLTTMGFRC